MVVHLTEATLPNTLVGESVPGRWSATGLLAGGRHNGDLAQTWIELIPLAPPRRVGFLQLDNFGRKLVKPIVLLLELRWRIGRRTISRSRVCVLWSLVDMIFGVFWPGEFVGVVTCLDGTDDGLRRAG